MPLSDVESIMGIGASGIEVRLDDVYKVDEVRREILKRVGNQYFIRTWVEMNKNLFSALKLEKAYDVYHSGAYHSCRQFQYHHSSS